MMESINSLILAVSDPLFNWMLRLPVDLVLIIVAVGTGTIITFSRRFTTNQNLLRRCSQDKKRLKELIREAKARGDKEAIQRHRATVQHIGLITMKQEGWPLLAALIPIALLGTWCFQRLAFIPPKAGETIVIHAYLPASAAGELAHMVPVDGVREVSQPGAGGKWIQEIAEDRFPPSTGTVIGAVATWNVQAEASPKPYKLAIHYKNASVEKELLVGQRQYSPDTQFYNDPTLHCVQIDMKPVKFLGVVHGIPQLMVPPWMLAYFLIAIPSVSLVKRIARIY
jgi:uncharacterized membrane protein (DUF106 family)